jgi:cyclophilin family peptidyl-prolyl cis-trans isomerase
LCRRVGPALASFSPAAAIAIAAVAVLGCARRGEPTRPRDDVAPPEPAAIFGAPPPAHARVDLETDFGTIHCEIDPARVPRAAALVAGLARGDAAFRDGHSGAVVRRRYYDGLTFFRRLPGELIQTGCPLGDGTGHPGYRIPVETSARDAELLAHPGALLMARYRSPPRRADPDAPEPNQAIGSQLAIALTPMTNNLGAVTVLGRCGDLDVVRKISEVPSTAPRPALRALRASW